MRHSALVVCACAIAMMSVVRAQGPAPQPRTSAAPASTRLPVRRVVLYKNGIGYFEHVGRVRGNQSVAISQLDDQQIAVFVHDSRENVRLTRALGPIQAQKAVIASIAEEIAHRQTEAASITQDQQRLRENMGALKGASGERQLLQRYLAQLNQQEDRIAVLRRETADLEQRLAQGQAELTALIRALALDVEVLDAAAADGSDSLGVHGEAPKRQ